ncbi:hypothetical protein V6N13_022969 [Hibiscus sabdariffa]|uniref:Uncharacterized protein n=1 Tax=Hibiscus sabdariffa TaxID=183260 RepID=A0ABR2B5C2_9ROSI
MLFVQKESANQISGTPIEGEKKKRRKKERVTENRTRHRVAGRVNSAALVGRFQSSSSDHLYPWQIQCGFRRFSLWGFF